MELRELHISGYRGIKEVDISLRRINLIIGPNNTGKSAILEAAGILLSKDSHFTDAKGTNLFDHLISTKKYEPQFFVNVEYNKAIIKSGKLEIYIEYQKKGLPSDTIVSTHMIELLKENIQQKVLREFPLGYNFAVEKVLSSFARELEIEDRNKVRSAITRLARKYKMNIDKIVEQSVRQFLEKSKLILYSPSTLFVYLPTSLRFPVDAGFGRYYVNISYLKHPSTMSNFSNIVLGLQRASSVESIYKLYDRLVELGKINSAIEVIKRSVPYIIDIRKTESDKIYVLSSLTTKPIPLTSMGDGFISLLEIAFSSGFIDDGVILLEEPELYLHPGFARIASETILHNSESKQFIITTHSLDFITDILSVANYTDKLDYMNVIRIHRREDIPDLVVETLPGEQALEEIESIGVDLRVT